MVKNHFGEGAAGTREAVEAAVEDFFDAFRRSRARLRRDPGLAQLSLAEFALLRAVAAQGADGVGRVARAADMAQPPASRGLDRLRQKGLVDIVAHPEDRRRVRVTMTPGGVRLLRHHRARLAATSELIIDRLGPDEAGRAPELLRLLGRALEDAADVPVADTGAP